MPSNSSNTAFLTLLSSAEAYVRKGHLPAAINCYKEIGNVDYNKLEDGARYAKLSLAIGEIFRAVQVYRKLADIAPEDGEIIAGFGRALLLNKQYHAAATVLRDALRLTPNSIDALSDLGATLIILGQFEEALQKLDRALELKPSHSEAASNKSSCLRNLGHYELALKWIRKAIQLNPSDPVAYHTMARIQIDMDSPEAAVVNFDKAISLDPTFGSAYHLRALAKKTTPEDRKTFEVAEQALRGSLPSLQRAEIHFALGKMHDDLSDFDSAFKNFRMGNLILDPQQRKSPPYKEFSVIRRVFNKSGKKQSGPFASDSKLPIFIVGMPRSGSTLIEQIISSHPAAMGVGESIAFVKMMEDVSDINDMKIFENKWKAHLRDKSLQTSADKYLAYIKKDQTDEIRVVDKQLNNFIFLGAIDCIFPNATILNAVRNPIDTCLSCYFQLLMDVRWSFDLIAIGRWYCFYREAMAHWQSVMPSGRIIDVNYEELVRNQEVESKRLITACGLNWYSGCLEFYNLKKIVTTASQAQVRNPIYKSSVNRWAPYAKHIEELVSVIYPYLSKSDFATLQKAGVKIRRHKYWLRNWI